MSKNKTKPSMSAADYAAAVDRRGGPYVVAAQLGIHVASVRKRMSGDSLVDKEAVMAIGLVPLAAERYVQPTGQPRKRRLSRGRVAKPDDLTPEEIEAKIRQSEARRTGGGKGSPRS